MGIEVHLRSIFLNGALFLPPDRAPTHLKAAAGRISRARRLIAEGRSDPLQAALGFALSRPEASAVLVGVTSAAEMSAVVAAAMSPPPDLDWDEMAIDDPTASPSAAGTMTVGLGGLNDSGFVTTPPFTTGQAMLYRAESVVYYVGRNANDNPALYRMRYTAAPGSAAVTAMDPEELVEGIESLQLEYAQPNNTGAATTPTGNIGSSLVATAVEPAADPETAWRRVGLVRVGLLARSTEPAAAEQRDGDATRLSALGVTFTPPDDTRYRAVYESTLALRNRLFGN